jgi:hypothetical protein
MRKAYLNQTRPKLKPHVYGAEARNRDALASDPVEGALMTVSTAYGTTMEPSQNEAAAELRQPKTREKRSRAKITSK